MSVEVLADPRAVAEAAAERFVDAASRAIDVAGRFLVALSGGSTPRPFFHQLGSPAYLDRVDWEMVHVFWADERCVPPSEPESNYAAAKESLLDQVDVKPGHVHRIRGEDDPETAALEYERLLRRAFTTSEGPPRDEAGARFDLIVLGMGEDGHTASLFPGTPAVSETERWVVPVAAPVPPLRRVSLTPPVLNAAAERVFLVTGEAKAPALARVLGGTEDPVALPASTISGATWLVDEAASTSGDP
jgi:6-phosphogluconolactonase